MVKVPVGNIALADVLERYLKHKGLAQQQPAQRARHGFHKEGKRLREKAVRPRSRYKRKGNELYDLRQGHSDVTTAVEELRQVFARGELVARHISERDGREFEASPSDWQRNPCFLTRGFFSHNDDSEAHYTDSDAFKTWLQRREPAGAKARTVVNEGRCRKWLVSQMMEGPRAKAKPVYRKEAETKFSVPARGFDRAWDDAVAEATASGGYNWTNPGRPKS